MADWLHFIGKRYYATPETFAVEAGKYGATRRIAKNILGKMSFGDTVHCAMRDDKGLAQVFGSFKVERLSGLSREAIIKIITEYEDRCELPEPDGPDGEMIERGCGEYTALPAIKAEIPLSEISDIISTFDDPGKIMVGGNFMMHANSGKLKDVKQRQGFRRFDSERFYFAIARLLENKFEPTVAGMFYSKDSKPTGAGGEFQAVAGYRRLETIQQDQRKADDEREKSRQPEFDFGEHDTTTNGANK